MRKSRNIIIAALVLVIVLGAYLYINHQSQENGIEEETDSELTISNTSRDKITKMILTSSKGEITIERKDDIWVLTGNEDIELDQDKVNDLAYSFAVIFAERIVEENPQDLEKYGLKSPVATVKAFFDDGDTREYYLGNKTPEGTTYYLMKKDDPKVYTVWMNHGENFSSGLDDLRNKKLTAINTLELDYLYIKQEDKPVIEIVSNINEELNKYGLDLWMLKQPYNHTYAVGSKDFMELLEKGFEFTIEEFVEDKPSDLSKYGLDEPRIEIQIKDTSNSLHLLVGSNKDDNLVYAKTADKDTVFTMAFSKLQPLLDLKPIDLIDRFVYIIDINLIDAIEIEHEGKVDKLTLSRTTKKSEDSDEEETITTYKVNGKEVEEEAFKDYYQNLIGITFDAELDKEVEKTEPEIRTTFTLNSGEKVTVEYVPYDDDFYTVYRDGVSDFVASKKKVKTMLDSLKELTK
ncbi:MAG: DUF4340 domain-containing protein [Epulopiscium sp.]|nr:DUF4340 domain-containing protein [Candidatus Epulonipiscium sp.]